MQVSWIDPDHLNALLAQITPEISKVEQAGGMAGPATVPERTDDFMAADADEEVCMSIEVPQASEPVVVSDIVVPAAERMAEVQPWEEDEHGRPLHNPAAAMPLSRIRDRLRAIRQRATEAGILARPMGMPSAVPGDAEGASGEQAPVAVATAPLGTPPFDIPSGSLRDRLSAFATWTRQVLHEDGGHVLVINDEGEVLWGGETRASLVLSAMMAWGAAVRSSASSMCGTPQVIYKTLSSGHVLTVIPCETSAGVFHAAVAAPAGVPEDISVVIRGALVAALESGHVTDR